MSFLERDAYTEFSPHSQPEHNEYLQKSYLSGVFKRYGIKNVEKLLDLGCNTGRLTKFLIGFAKQVHGADVLEGYRTPYLSLHPESTYSVITENRIPFDDGFFDVVFTCLVFQHFSAKTLIEIGREIKRVLKDDGLLISYEGINPTFRENSYDLVGLKRIELTRVDIKYGVFVFGK